MKSIPYSYLLPVVLIVAVSCDSMLSTRDKSDALERQVAVGLEITDPTGLMRAAYGTDGVPDAQVVLQSNTFGTSYTFTTDAAGVVTLRGLPSDDYFLSIVRTITDQERQFMSEPQAGTYRLINRQMPVVALSPRTPATMALPLQLTYEGATIVFSEIYASGPPGAGLYFHDKYVEFYNQSDTVQYLDGLVVARVYSNASQGLNYVNDPEFVWSNNVWIFPGSGTDYPIQPGQFVVCAQDAIDHRINAPQSVDLSQADFEFYKDDAPDVNNPAIPNMIRIFQDSGVDWLIGGETDALVLARVENPYNLATRNGLLLIRIEDVIDGVEYLRDPSRLDLKKLTPKVDAGAAGGVQFYTGRAMERRWIQENGRWKLSNTNNSSVDFRIIDRPTPRRHSITP
jgi:hypothetical protein